MQSALLHRVASVDLRGIVRHNERDVMDDAARDRLVGNISGHLLNGVTEPVLQRAFQYWKNVDKELGDKVEQRVRAGRP